MIEKFMDVKFSKGTGAKLATAMGILDEYGKAGYILTLRQLYYQLVSRGTIPNNINEYSKLSYLMVKARMGGLVDWAAIEDRLRIPQRPYWVINIPHALNDTLKQYRLNRQKGQAEQIEVWCEKDALSGVLRRVTEHYHINLLINRGYSSATAMYDAGHRLCQGKRSHILYLGDHDPSGLDMIRDIKDRLRQFGSHPKIHRIALTQPQIKKYDPPPNPAKWKDKRAEKYVAEFGETCWEVDALPPDVLEKLLEDRIKKLVDLDQFQQMLDLEKADKHTLEEMIKDMKG